MASCDLCREYGVTCKETHFLGRFLSSIAFVNGEPTLPYAGKLQNCPAVTKTETPQKVATRIKRNYEEAQKTDILKEIDVSN